MRSLHGALTVEERYTHISTRKNQTQDYGVEYCCYCYFSYVDITRYILIVRTCHISILCTFVNN